MAKKESIYQKVTLIRDETIHRLDELKIPAYPASYKKVFEEIFHANADLELTKALERSSSFEEKMENMGNYLQIAQLALETFTQSHAEISRVATMQSQHLHELGQHDPALAVNHCAKIIHGLSALGEEMAAELKRADEKIKRLSTELQEAMKESTVDPLTQTFNRRALQDDMQEILHAGENRTLSLVMLLIDADNFKNLNDRYGHIAGDKILYYLSQSFKTVLRATDKIYRFGGEEFVVVLNRCGEEAGYQTAEKLRTKIENSRIIYNGETIMMTISIGMTVHHAGDTFEALIARADEALYQAKRSGKNTIGTVGLLKSEDQ